MSDFSAELIQSAVSLEAASNTAMAELGLAPGGFTCMYVRQDVLVYARAAEPDASLHPAGYVTDLVTLYGGGSKAPEFGRILATINEPVPAGTSPASCVRRDLHVWGGSITVDTVLDNPSLDDGPFVVEDGHMGACFRQVTHYAIATGKVAVRSGQFINAPFEPIQDRTSTISEPNIDHNVLRSRVAVLLHTMGAVSAIFSKIAQNSEEDVTWKVV